MNSLIYILFFSDKRNKKESCCCNWKASSLPLISTVKLQKLSFIALVNLYLSSEMLKLKLLALILFSNVFSSVQEFL